MKFPALRHKTVALVAIISFLILLGVQVVWLGNTFRLYEKDFDEKLKNTLRVFNNDFQASPVLNAHMMQVWNNPAAAQALSPALRYAIDTCFQRNSLPTDYVYGLATTKGKDLFWTSDTSYKQQIAASKSSIIALCRKEAGALEMKFHFPHKQQYLAAALTPMLLVSGATLLVLALSLATLVYMFRKLTRLSLIRNDFVNNMTHELKTPLFTVSIASKMLEAQHRGADPKQSRYIQSIRQEVKRLDNLVEKILQASLLEKKQLTLQRKRLNLHELITRTVDRFSLIQEHRQGAITLALEAARHEIEGDETHIENSIFNLLDNAFKYAEAQPEVTITTCNKGNYILLSIIDNGIGIDRPTRHLVFERFFRAHTGNLHTVKGFGIGLSYVRSVAEAHSGSITVHSILHKGSTFTLQLPLRQS